MRERGSQVLAKAADYQVTGPLKRLAKRMITDVLSAVIPGLLASELDSKQSELMSSKKHIERCEG